MLPIETTVESKYRGSAKDSSSSSSSGSLRCTGQLQDVMKESSEIAYSFSKGFLLKSQPDNSFFARSNIHLHALAGAIPKDGKYKHKLQVPSMFHLFYRTIGRLCHGNCSPFPCIG